MRVSLAGATHAAAHASTGFALLVSLAFLVVIVAGVVAAFALLQPRDSHASPFTTMSRAAALRARVSSRPHTETPAGMDTGPGEREETP